MARRGPVYEEVDLNMTPLIDCVFLLLIFFMVTTVFKQPYSLQVELPQARQGVIIVCSMLTGCHKTRRVWLL